MAGFGGFSSLEPCSPYELTHHFRELLNNVICTLDQRVYVLFIILV